MQLPYCLDTDDEVVAADDDDDVSRFHTCIVSSFSVQETTHHFSTQPFRFATLLLQDDVDEDANEDEVGSDGCFEFGDPFYEYGQSADDKMFTFE